MISVALVDDHSLLRNGLSSFIQGIPGMQVVFEADNGLDLQDKLKGHARPDVVLMDINMPLMDGYEATKWLRASLPEVKVIALSMYDGEDCIIRMLRCGARGYLLKDTEPSELTRAILETHRHGFYYTPMVTRHIADMLRDQEEDKKTAAALTEREIQLLQYMASELTYKEIAEKMFLSPKTIEGHREKLCDKLRLKTRVGLVLYAIRNGIVKV